MSSSGKPMAYMIAARRTPVAPRGGALASYQADELAAPVLAALLRDAGLAGEDVDQVFLGNALYAGGNPARMAALRARLPQSVPAMTIDTQCCSGLDAILQGVRLIESGAADCVLAGGAESFSRAPIRMHRPLDGKGEPSVYARPAFAPPPYNDPDLADAAARLAAERRISREAQAEFAVSSHSRAREASGVLQAHMVRIGNEHLVQDSFTRDLTRKAALRAPLLAGDRDTGLNAATIACEADAAAAVLLVSERYLVRNERPALKILGGHSAGGSPADPALVPIEVAKDLFRRLGLGAGDLDCVELMEAYAVQAMVTANELRLAKASLNRLGGGLARGHPIGASGAILAIQLFARMTGVRVHRADARSYGMALIAAAGGLGTGIVFKRAC